ncbi:MAG: DUF362 domain-containing protein [Candidatus Bathyarchaeota archaeon]|nr:DUF362 domain-containing protein [Candidatus Bathyarchaeota archaeon]MDH5494552.1 DUF362 domain-containing protein [Candidatus Bathyarchaeota archaeon]
MVVVGKVDSAKDFRHFLKELDVKGVVFVVKPNWSNANTFTSAETLDWLFSALKGRIKVIEGYTAWRNELNTGPEPQEVITPSNAKAKWQWIKEQDKWFLRFSGIDKILSKYDVEYINVTEEVWSNRTLNPDEVRDFVDNKYGILVRQEVYSFVPTKVYELRDSTFISLNNSRRIREHVSLSTKNLFGLIPDPARYGKWHGKNDSYLSRSIVDINKIYRSLFSPCYWINEMKELGVFVGSKNSVEADAVTAKLMGIDPGKIDYLRKVANIFGGYDEKVLTKIPKSL